MHMHKHTCPHKHCGATSADVIFISISMCVCVYHFQTFLFSLQLQSLNLNWLCLTPLLPSVSLGFLYFQLQYLCLHYYTIHCRCVLNRSYRVFKSVPTRYHEYTIGCTVDYNNGPHLPKWIGTNSFIKCL